MTTLSPTGRALIALAALAMPLAAAQAMKPLGFMFSQEAGMNMMMSEGSIDISAYPGAKLLVNKMSGGTATLVYAGSDAKGVFAFYDRAILAEGWKHSGAMTSGDTMKAGDKMAGTSMAADKMMKGGDAMMAGKMATAAEYTLKNHTLSLSVKASAGRVTVTFVSK